jgi:tRNA nucleotidyltransferase/poly(A) polymerase
MPELPQVFPAPPIKDTHDLAVFSSARAVTGKLASAGFTSFFAGGFARDLLIGRRVHDIDIATDATPELIQSLFPDSRSFGKSFGVIQVEQDGFFFEVATFRKDMDYQDGRHPSHVTFSTPAEDAERRDFTINGMFYDPMQQTIIDYVSGKLDIDRKIIRAIGDPALRFREDYLRIMRAVRFSSVLNFTIEHNTWTEIQLRAPTLADISIERIRDEFIRTLMEAPQPGDALGLFKSAGILDVVFPELSALSGVMQPPEFHPEGDVFTHVQIMLNSMKVRSHQLIWSILLHDIGKPATYAVGTDKHGASRIQFRGHAELGSEMGIQIMRRFKCSNDDIESVYAAVRNHMRFIAVPDMKNSTLRKWVGAPTFSLELELHRIDCVSSHGKLDHYQLIKNFQQQLLEQPVLPTPLVKGQDLIRMGFAAGPALGRALKSVYDHQLEGEFSNREQALQWLNNHICEVKESNSPVPDSSTDVDE